MEQVTVFDMLRVLVDGWDKVVVRVKQGGRMRFMKLGEVQDQKLVFKMVRDLLKQGAKENGIL